MPDGGCGGNRVPGRSGHAVVTLCSAGVRHHAAFAQATVRGLGLPADPPPILPSVRLFLTATSLLFVELLIIRWIPAEVIYVGYFRNFLLMAAFLGIGVGILAGRVPNRIQISPFGPVLLALVVLVTQFPVSIELTSPDEIFFGLSESEGADINFLVLPALVILATVIMAGLAVPLGPC